MSKSTRLIQLLSEIRLHDPPVTAGTLADAMQVSERTIYRDIESLREAGAQIDGEAGYGYSLTEDPALPPQIYTREEIEALVLGLGEVQAIGDPALAKAAKQVLAKLHATLPPRLKGYLKHSVLHVKRFNEHPKIKVDASAIRQAAWDETALDIHYKDAKGAYSQRRVLPLSIVYFDDTLVLISYCQLRQDTRMFRMDRIEKITITDESFYPKRVRLLKEALVKVQESN